MSEQAVLEIEEMSYAYPGGQGCRAVSFELFPGEVLGIVGESGAGKSTVLRCLATELMPQRGTVRYRGEDAALRDLHALSEPERRKLLRTEWALVHQNPRDGLRMGVSAGGNVAERLLANRRHHYGRVRTEAANWLRQVEIDPERMDELPSRFSGGMQQRVQLARNLVSQPRVLLMDEPTGGLDVSVQARLLDLIRRLTGELRLSAVLITHDLGVVRLLAQRLLVMQGGRIVEQGLTDQLLDDPQHPYTQLLVSSILQG